MLKTANINTLTERTPAVVSDEFFDDLLEFDSVEGVVGLGFRHGVIINDSFFFLPSSKINYNF